MSSDSSTNHLKTPLYSKHSELKARILPFHNWLMPIYYNSIIKEHEATRTSVAVFDVSHMGEFIVRGTDAYDFLLQITPARLDKLSKGKVCYSMLLDEHGGIIDDITIYCLSDNRDEYQICVNAGNIEKDWTHINNWSRSFSNLELKNISSEVALLAIQGPLAPKLLNSIFDDSILALPYYHCRRYEFCGSKCLLARMGYTGEDGYEWFMPIEIAEMVWDKLQNSSPRPIPAGLGARDILRLEMGYPLHGQDISLEYNPLEAGLAWTLRKDEKYLGAHALKKHNSMLKRKLVGLKTKEKAAIRPGDKVFLSIEDAQNSLNELTTINSGTISPILNTGIGLCYLPLEYSKLDLELYISSGRRILEAQVVKLPFINNPIKPYLK